MELVKSTKGKDNIIYNGYMYVKQQEKNGRIRWVCDKKNNGCSVDVMSNNDLSDPRLTKPRTHASDMIGVHAVKKRAEMNDMALHSIAPPSAVLAAAIQNTDDDIRSRVGTAEVCARSMLRARRRMFPAESDDLANLVIPAALSTSGPNQRRFLLHDNGAGNGVNLQSHCFCNGRETSFIS